MANTVVSQPPGLRRPMKPASSWLFHHQIDLSFAAVAGLLLAHTCVPKARPFTSRFLTLKGYSEQTGKYASGHDDLCFVAFCVVLFSGIRASSMKFVLAPFATHCGATPKNVVRFSEQGWMFMYNAVSWTVGMYIYSTSPYFLNTRELWTNWPEKDLDGLLKVYVLAQWAYWTQQLIVVNIEQRRHDYWQMVVHHLVTILLIASAYAYFQNRVANLILVSMDVIELIFPLAKCLKCLGFTAICDILFVLFVITWLVTRHVLYLMICWSAYFESPWPMPAACFKGPADRLQGPFPVPNDYSYLEPFWDPTGTVCMDEKIRLGFVAWLLLLQTTMILWSAFIVQVAVRVLRGDSAEDVRSDEEYEEAATDGEGQEKAPLAVDGSPEQRNLGITETVGVDGIDLAAWQQRERAGKKEMSHSSGIRLARHSDRKELLNRIGCEKQIE